MNKETPSKLVSKFIIVFGLISLLGAGASYFLINYYQVSFITLVNKVANKLSLVESGDNLVPHHQRYADSTIKPPINLPFPRVFLTRLRNWNGLTTPEFYTKRLSNIKSEQLGYRIDCEQTKLWMQLQCYIDSPSLAGLQQLERSFIDFELTSPNLSGNYGNAWHYVMLFDIAKASPYFSVVASAEIERKLARMLTKYLALLDGDSASLWHGRASLASSAFLIASVLESASSQYRTLYRRAYGHFNDFYHAISATETWPEGYNYWINNRALQVIMALSAFKNQQHQPEQAHQVLATIKRIGLWHIYLTRADFKVEGWGDEGPRIDLKDESAKVIDLIAQVTNELVFYQFAQLIRKKRRAESYYSGYRWLLPFLYNDSETNRQPTADSSMSIIGSSLATSELFGRDVSNHLNIRSDWTDSGTFITYRAGHTFTHHQHYDAGHFTIFKGAPLATNTSRYNGKVDSEYRKNFGIRTLSKNSLLVQRKDEIVRPSPLLFQNVAAGGQRLVMPMGSAIKSFEDWQQQLYQGQHVEGAQLINYQHRASEFTAITSDLTASYNSNSFDANGGEGKVKQIVRTLVYLMRKDLVLINDRLLTSRAADKTKWLLHSINQPQFIAKKLIKGSQTSGIFKTTRPSAQIINGQSSMRLDILAPTKPVTTIIGGADFRYYVEVDGDDTSYDGTVFSMGAIEPRWYDSPQWRMEISPHTQTTDTHYLVAMQPRITNDNIAVIVPKVLAVVGGNATVFDDLLVLADFKSSELKLKLDSSIAFLGIFADHVGELQLNHSGSAVAEKYSLEPGFNYIKLVNMINGSISLELIEQS